VRFEGKLGGRPSGGWVRRGVWKDLPRIACEQHGRQQSPAGMVRRYSPRVPRRRPNGDLSKEDHVDLSRARSFRSKTPQQDGRPSQLITPSEELIPASRARSAPRQAGRQPVQGWRRDGKTSLCACETAWRNMTGPGAQHRRGQHRCRQWRPLQADQRRCHGRDPSAQRPFKHVGRQLILIAEVTRRTRSRSGSRDGGRDRRRCRVWPSQRKDITNMDNSRPANLNRPRCRNIAGRNAVPRLTFA